MIQSCFAYNGKDFSIVENQTAVIIAGNAIVLWNTLTNHKDYIWSNRRGYCRATANYHKNYVAAAEYGLNPEIHIYEFPSKKLKYSFPLDTTVKCIGLCFSRDGKYLIAIGGVPDFRISIYDIEQGKKVGLPETKLPCKPEEFISVKFNPGDSMQFAILSQMALYNYFIRPAYETYDNEEKLNLRESFRLEETSFKALRPQASLTRFIWDQYARWIITTDDCEILMVNSRNLGSDPTPEPEQTLKMPSRPATIVLTLKYLVVSLVDGILQWLPLEPPVYGINEKENNDKGMVIKEQPEQEWVFGVKVGESEVSDYISHLHYSKTFNAMLCGTETGVFGILNIEAETINEEDEEEDHAQKKEKRILSQPFIELGRFHVKKVFGVRELGNSTQLVTISQDHYLSVWESTTQEMLCAVFQPAYPTALDVSLDGTAAFLGTSMGAFRVYDVRNRSAPRLVSQLRFFESPVPIDIMQTSHDGSLVIVGSSKMREIYFVAATSAERYVVKGFVRFEGTILSACFHKEDGVDRLLVVLSNNLLACADVPKNVAINRMEPIPADESNIKYRKVDRGSQIVMSCFATKDLWVTGEDKLIKKYQLPNEAIGQMDWKRAPAHPVEEYTSHSVGTSCWQESQEFKLMATGGKDGTVLLRHVGNINQMPQPLKAQAVFTGGVTSIAFSRTRSTLYTAGGDGSVMCWNIGGKTIKDNSAIYLSPKLSPELDLMLIVERVAANQIKLFKDILMEEFNAQQVAVKEQIRIARVTELEKVRDGLISLLQENETVTDIERLDRDEFIIDVARKDQVEAEGEKECNEIKKEAEKTVLRLQLLRERVKQSTWDTMDVQQKAVKSIMSDTLIFNFPVRKRLNNENNLYQMVVNTRTIELREKLAKLENGLKDMLDEEDFSTSIENYVMNRTKGKQLYEEDISIQEAAAEFAAKDAEKKAKRDKMEASINVQANANAVGKKQPILKITKGKLKQGTKKRVDDDEEAAAAARSKQNNTEIRGMEEMHWKVIFQKQQIEELKAKLANPSAFDIIYEPFELYTDVRKRNQIEVLKTGVFELKKEFNKEFTALEKYKEDQIFVIKEKNEQIGELLYNLKQQETLFEPTSHILENPEHILTIDVEKEIKVEKYLTKEERAELEEKRRRDEEREAALKGDNVGQRGLKTMLGGTELNLKKDKNVLQSEYIREDWMNKPESDMTDEERQKFKEFEQKEKEFKEKQKKAWEQELKKIKGEIEEIKMRFEERLLTLFKKKLFVDVRVLEQELIIIRLVIMLHDGKETRADEKKLRNKLSELEHQKNERDEIIHSFDQFVKDLQARIEDDEAVQTQNKALKTMFGDQSNFKAIQAFVKTGKQKKLLGANDVNPREVELSKNIIALDPFSTIDRQKIKDQLKDEDEIEIYDYEKDNVADLDQQAFQMLVQQRNMRADMTKDKEKLEKSLKGLSSHIQYLDEEMSTVEEKFADQVKGQQDAAKRINKIRYNFETIIYIKQGQVEVPQQPVATDYKLAILIDKSVIDDENSEIIKKGNAKVEKMKEISTFKTGLKRSSYETKKLKLEITDFEERAKDVQLYRVTKQTQEIIQGKAQKKDEEDKKRLENQMTSLISNMEKRIKTIEEKKQKLKKEISNKQAESSELETKAYQLQNNVNQRQQIMSLKSNTMTDGDADPTNKIREIAIKRKLLDIAKQQTEEIEVLRDELDRLRAKTFPSFAHLHDKQPYPDKN